VVEKIWLFEVWRTKFGILESFRGVNVNMERVEGFGIKIKGWKCNLENIQGSKWKMVGCN
jgi:hypothetical protein